jgi:hypothetical protein
MLIVRHPHGPRLYIAGRRLHHGVAGLAVAAICTLFGHRRLALASAAYGATDWRDFPFRDSNNH